MVVRHTSGTALELSLDRPNFLFRVLSNDTVYGVKGDVSDGKAFKRVRGAHVAFEPDSDTDEQLLVRARPAPHVCVCVCVCRSVARAERARKSALLSSSRAQKLYKCSAPLLMFFRHPNRTRAAGQMPGAGLG